ncbi:MAG TPA: condensation domain-containing protein, partial [Thermoanaerobaculia bacterium]
MSEHGPQAPRPPLLSELVFDFSEVERLHELIEAEGQGRRSQPVAPRELPRNPLEELLAGIFCRVLGTGEVGVEESFFSAGGNSLLATQVLSAVRRACETEVALDRFLERPTVAGLAAALAETRPGVAAPHALLSSVVRPGRLPLSFAQQRLWFLDQLQPGSSAYSIALALHLDGPLRVSVLHGAVAEVLRRQEALRTGFVLDGGEPVQVVRPAVLAFCEIDLSCLEEPVRAAEAERVAAWEAQRPFDLSRPPLLRSLLLRLDAQRHVLLITTHHIACDGSLPLLGRELAELYAADLEGRPPRLPALPVQYADFAAWQREWLQSQFLEGELAYWRERLAGAPVLELPADRPRPPVRSERGARRRFPLRDGLLEEVRAWSGRVEATLFMTLLTAFQTLLYRYTGQPDVVLGTPIVNRPGAATEELIGCFVDILPLREICAPDLAFRDLVEQVRRTALAAYAHRYLPFDVLVAALQPERSLSHAP